MGSRAGSEAVAVVGQRPSWAAQLGGTHTQRPSWVDSRMGSRAGSEAVAVTGVVSESVEHQGETVAVVRNSDPCEEFKFAVINSHRQSAASKEIGSMIPPFSATGPVGAAPRRRGSHPLVGAFTLYAVTSRGLTRYDAGSRPRVSFPLVGAFTLNAGSRPRV